MMMRLGRIVGLVADARQRIAGRIVEERLVATPRELILANTQMRILDELGTLVRVLLLMSQPRVHRAQ